jgi:tRNA dimethylallyltransferase
VILTSSAAWIVALQCWRALPRAKGRLRTQAPPPRGICVGNDRAVADRVPSPRAHPDSLLARHSLEPALTAPHETAGHDPLLVVVLGPTASGKTALSLALAHKFQGEIVNCDSVSMYREFDIGTAKPSAAERARAPHHLFDCVDPAMHITAGEYARRARQVLEEIKSRGLLPIVVGGTGLYLRAVLEGLFPGPQRSEELRERLRERAAARGSAYLHRILSHLDPGAADKIHAHDAPKLIRAIEVCIVSRGKMTELWQQGRDALQGFRILRIGLDPDRAALYTRINERANQMFDAGLIEETKALLAKYSESAWALSSLGYKQAMQFLRSGISREQAVQAAQQAHRNYAKRQMTWFRRELDVLWLKGFGDDPGIQARVVARVEALLAANSRR